jgi:hypothetical protein
MAFTMKERSAAAPRERLAMTTVRAPGASKSLRKENMGGVSLGFLLTAVQDSHE